MKDDYSRPLRDKKEAERLRDRHFSSRAHKRPTLRHLKDKLFSEVKHYRFWKACQIRGGFWRKMANDVLKRHLKRLLALVFKIKKSRRF